MRKLPFTLLVLLFFTLIPVWFMEAQTAATDTDDLDKQQEWIQSILSEQDPPIKYNDYLFFVFGHRGFNWSIVASDSSGFHFYNGTSRDDLDADDSVSLDTLSFIKDNINTLTWGFDSLACAAKLLKPKPTREYTPFDKELFVIKNNKLVLKYHSPYDYYTGPDSVKFGKKFSDIYYLMFWLASPLCRSLMPTPSDTLL